MIDKKASWLWLLQRVSAVLLFIILNLHIKHVHYLELGKPILFAGVALRLKDLLMLAVDSSLLFLALFHGLNGLRTVLLDYSPLTKFERFISWLLLVIGLIFLFLGVRGLWAFIIK